MKKIPLTQGKFAIVDDEDFEFLTRWKWHFSVGTVVNRGKLKSGSGAVCYMYQLIDKTPKGSSVVFLNNDRLDLRKKNLKRVKKTQGRFGSYTGLKYRNSSSVFKGVLWNKKLRKWQCFAKKDGKNKHLGLFEEEVDAAIAYNEFAIAEYGKDALINNIPKVTR